MSFRGTGREGLRYQDIEKLPPVSRLEKCLSVIPTLADENHETLIMHWSKPLECVLEVNLSDQEIIR